ncbi:MAG: hypothetical protein AAFO76_06940 [Cyanobacteria bacterium J06607_15]
MTDIEEVRSNPQLIQSEADQQDCDRLQQIQEIELKFNFYNPLEITNYLVKNSTLIPILLDAQQQIKQVFEGQAKLSLKLCSDPDVSDWDKLSLSIHVGCDADVDRICSFKESLDDNWWIDTYSLVPNLNINVSFDDL